VGTFQELERSLEYRWLFRKRVGLGHLTVDQYGEWCILMGMTVGGSGKKNFNRVALRQPAWYSSLVPQLLKKGDNVRISRLQDYCLPTFSGPPGFKGVENGAISN